MLQKRSKLFQLLLILASIACLFLFVCYLFNIHTSANIELASFLQHFEGLPPSLDDAEIHPSLGLRHGVKKLRKPDFQPIQPLPEAERIYMDDSLPTEQFSGGTLYVHYFGYLYVPDECTRETRCCIYFAGGGGEDLLYRRGVYEYLENYRPNAIMLFFYESGFAHKEYLIGFGAEVMKQTAAECGIRLHDMITVGSSNGCYTALRAAAVLFTDYDIPVRAALLLDAGLEWELPETEMLSDEQCAAVAEEGTLLCLFEQPGVGMNYGPIARMVELGDQVLVIWCRDKGHNRISVNAYHYGLFSWGLQEYEQLDADEYTPILLQPENP